MILIWETHDNPEKDKKSEFRLAKIHGRFWDLLSTISDPNKSIEQCIDELLKRDDKISWRCAASEIFHYYQSESVDLKIFDNLIDVVLEKPDPESWRILARSCWYCKEKDRRIWLYKKFIDKDDVKSWESVLLCMSLHWDDEGLSFIIPHIIKKNNSELLRVLYDIVGKKLWKCREMVEANISWMIYSGEHALQKLGVEHLELLPSNQLSSYIRYIFLKKNSELSRIATSKIRYCAHKKEQLMLTEEALRFDDPQIIEYIDKRVKWDASLYRGKYYPIFQKKVIQLLESQDPLEVKMGLNNISFLSEPEAINYIKKYLTQEGNWEFWRMVAEKICWFSREPAWKELIELAYKTSDPVIWRIVTKNIWRYPKKLQPELINLAQWKKDTQTIDIANDMDNKLRYKWRRPTRNLEEVSDFHRLYKGWTNFIRRDFWEKNNWAKTTLLWNELAGKAIIRHFPIMQFLFWFGLSRDKIFWEKHWFHDYIPIEPIISARLSSNPNQVDVACKVLDGNVEDWLRNNKNHKFNDAITHKMNTIKKVLKEEKKLFHNHSHTENFCLLWKRNPDGSINYDLEPQVYMIDFDILTKVKLPINYNFIAD